MAFNSFFAHEGQSLPDAERLHRLAHIKLGEYSYWLGLSPVVTAAAVRDGIIQVRGQAPGQIKPYSADVVLAQKALASEYVADHPNA